MNKMFRYIFEFYPKPEWGYYTTPNHPGVLRLGYIGLRMENIQEEAVGIKFPECAFFLPDAPEYGEYTYLSGSGWIFSSSKPRVPHCQVTLSYDGRKPCEFFAKCEPDCSNVIFRKAGCWNKIEKQLKENLRKSFMDDPFCFKDYALVTNKLDKKS